MLHHPALEASFIATYVENYLDHLENLPNAVQPFISEIKLLDIECYKLLRQLDALKGKLGEAGQDGKKKTQILSDIKLVLAQGQLNGDAKIRALEKISELVELKSDQLDHDVKNLEPPRGDPQPGTTGMGRRNMFHSKTSSPNRPSSVGVSHRGGHLDRQSGRFGAEMGGLERHSAGGANSSSAAHKRARRQKQFPDFIRESELAGPPPAAGKRERPAGSSTPNSNASNEKPEKKNLRSVSNKRKRKDTAATNYDIPVDPDEPVYCLCEQVSYGEMIGCDNDHCEIEWFHFQCVSLASKPRGKWYCPNCRGGKPNVLKSSLANK